MAAAAGASSPPGCRVEAWYELAAREPVQSAAVAYHLLPAGLLAAQYC